MSWPQVVVRDWMHFAELAAKLTLPHPTYVPYLMRGQADAGWELKPTLLRLFPPSVTCHQALEVEAFGLREFQAQAHLHLPAASLPQALPIPFVGEWLALMQHYNAPTRLLDWTLSAYVAAYYAVEKELVKDGAVFVVRMATLAGPFQAKFPNNQIYDKDVKEADSPAVILPWEPPKKTERFIAQQGYFTLSINILGNQERLITECCEREREKDPIHLSYEKWVINSHLKTEFLRKLRAMNITGHSLFPGLDGLGRSLSEAARLASILFEN